MKGFSPFTATGIGSMPYSDADQAASVALKYFPDAPFWPQLPKLGFAEDMLAQYTDGIPGVSIDTAARRIRVDLLSADMDDLTAFYGDVVACMESPEASVMRGHIGEDHARGLYAFERALSSRKGNRPSFVKVQTTGPCTFSLSSVDTEGSPAFYREDVRDVVVKGLALKCRWQIRKFKQYADKILCFLDEPILSAFGSSAYIGVQRADVVAMLEEVSDAIHSEGALCGVHCCGNTEWTILTDAGVDVVNFDAYSYGETIAIYHSAVERFLRSGGQLAWGVVPTSDTIRSVTVEELERHLYHMIDHLSSKGIDRDMILSGAWLTPSCGAGSMSVTDSEKVFEMTRTLSDRMRCKFGMDRV